MDEAPKREGQEDLGHAGQERKPVLIDVDGEVFVSHTRDPLARWLINDIRLLQLNGQERIRIHELSNGTVVVFPPDFRLPEHFRRRFASQAFGWIPSGEGICDALRHEPPPTAE